MNDVEIGFPQEERFLEQYLYLMAPSHTETLNSLISGLSSGNSSLILSDGQTSIQK
jgi:hypothetical protein